MIYFDNAATSYPKPPEVFAAMTTFMAEAGGNPGRSGHRLATAAEAMLDEARNALGKFFGVKDPHRVVFAFNCTDALNMALKGFLDLHPGAHVISSMAEHNSVNRPLQQAHDDKRIRLQRVGLGADGAWGVDEVLDAVTPGTKFVALTHCSNVTGVIAPAAELGRALRAKHPRVRYLVDAAQTAGVVPLDLEAACIDFLCFPGHKALFGPPGTGALLLGERVKPEELHGWREGGTGGDSSTPHQPRQWPYFLEGGTPNSMGIAGLLAGLRVVQARGLEKILAHEQALQRRLIEKLGADERFTLYGTREPSRKAGVLSVALRGRDAADVATILDSAFEVCVRPGLHCAPYTHKALGTFESGGTVRLSPGLFNSLEECDAVVAALTEIVG
ncbi:MAG: aminotransferase class V-fold PLP-dependent enzyme [Planctomycetota bacterium]|nr:aminotransferase class V-fold PLP-dependent enzyme [Planctomycetota bacterium]